MTRFVLDASVALRWVLSNPVPAYARRVRRLMFDGARAVVPALWHLEMANGLAVAERRGILSTPDADQALDSIELLLGQAMETDTALVPVRQALVTARTFQLSAYDASYLDVARHERLPLATLDEDLRAAAARAGVALIH
ncbi:MAG: type II toxin-antitoxin system VapC family toxin [Terriglobia bacterium]